MSRFFYTRLAKENLRKNKSLYLPYILTAIGMNAMYYIMQAITWDKGIEKMFGAEQLRMILELGCAVIAIFAVIFLFYTNSFLMKRRKKEFGLFNILGMEKRHIGKMMFWETLMIGAISVLCGLAVGIIFNKVMVLLLLRITHLEVSFGFSIYGKGLVSTAILFALIYAATLLYNLFQIQKAKPVELLKSESQGEAEPKTRGLLAVIGVVALAGGYYIAITTADPVEALMLFFVAVILVIIGTYCLFTAGSIVLLKMLRKNKKYYYQTAHFTSVSGMIYRMKQNAVGLANICILSTAVLVMISGTVSLYAGMNQTLKKQYPCDIAITGQELSKESEPALQEMVEQSAQETGIEVEYFSGVEQLGVTVTKAGEKMSMNWEEGDTAYLTFLTLSEYEKMTGEKETLEDNEILVYVYQGDKEAAGYNIEGNQFQIKKYLENYPKEQRGMGAIVVAVDSYYIVVKDESVLERIDQVQKECYGDNASYKQYQVQVNVTGNEKQQETCGKLLKEKITSYNETMLRDGTNAWIDEPNTLAEGKQTISVFYGGFLFLGIFLGLVFLLATVLIIYYKQISEGYEDKGRYEIMQKVGMSHKEIKASIRSQIVKVFFLPLVTACIHLIVAFPLIKRLLLLFGMSDAALFAGCCVVTAAVFAVIYGIVYGVTARTYYKIVE